MAAEMAARWRAAEAGSLPCRRICRIRRASSKARAALRTVPLPSVQRLPASLISGSRSCVHASLISWLHSLAEQFGGSLREDFVELLGDGNEVKMLGGTGYRLHCALAVCAALAGQPDQRLQSLCTLVVGLQVVEQSASDACNDHP